MHWILILFWICTGIAVYTYLGYGLLCYLLVKCKIHPPKNHHADVLEDLPDLTLVIFAYNEASCIEQKIINSLNLSYPEEKKHILVVTDGSTDGTQDIALQFTNIQVLHQPERRGKAAAMNRAMTGIKSEVVVFTDANTYVHSEALIRLAAYYSDPQVGGVAGEKRVMATDASTAGQGENLYWKYESWLKRTDAELYTVVGAAGELYSIRTALYEPLPEDTILDDFVLSLQIVQKGYRFAYAPEAWSMEAPSASLREEQKRKIRICAGGFQAMRRLTPLLNIFRYGIASFQYISHRVLRWAVVPFLLPFIFLLNLWLMHAHAGVAYFFTGYAQIMFYAMAGIGYVFALQDRKMKGVYPMYYFVFMNLAVYAGLWRWIKGKQEVKWDKAKRSQSFISKYV
jgi:biofilm PGA synthesis N-glycosyltransferase PgaC